MLAAAIVALALADAPGSWVVDVTTTGGYTGRGAGAVSVRSDGAAACDAPLQCARAAPGDALASLTSSLEAIRGVTWDRPASRTTCNDCIVTTMTVHIRQTDGTESRVAYTWDNVEAPLVPPPVLTLYDTVMRLAHR